VTIIFLRKKKPKVHGLSNAKCVCAVKKGVKRNHKNHKNHKEKTSLYLDGSLILTVSKGIVELHHSLMALDDWPSCIGPQHVGSEQPLDLREKEKKKKFRKIPFLSLFL